MMEEVATKSDEVPVSHVMVCFLALVLALLVAPALRIVSHPGTFNGCKGQETVAQEREHHD